MDFEKQLIQLFNEDNSFGFEVHCSDVLRKHSYQMKQGGFYTDPVTRKDRQYDIWAWRDIDGENCIYLAAECKNISGNLVTFSTPRKSNESYNYILNPQPNHITKRIDGNDFYRVNAPVARSMDVAKVQDGKLSKAKGEDPYERYIQAINSSSGLLDFSSANSPGKRILILPILIIPDNKLWNMEFDPSGKVQNVNQVTHTTYFMDVECGGRSVGRIRHSHLLICTVRGLEILADYFGTLKESNLQNWFGDDSFKG